MSVLFGLVDCNSFYCSCEKLFRPDLDCKRPIVVLSNNDGCAIAFNRPAKAIGFGEMCEPFFKVKERIQKYNVAVFSSNYALYDNMSKRVMTILQDFAPYVEVYSVDEAFLHFDGFNNYDVLEYAKMIHYEVRRQSGIPVGVGIGKTKVLAKAANKMAKKNKGYWVLDNDKVIDECLKNFPCKDIWGIGSASARKLQMLGINTALEFKNYKNDKLIQKLLTKTGREIQEELRGVSCLQMEHLEDKKNTGNSRSFGQDIYDKGDIKEAIAVFASNSAEKLRKQNSVCYSISVFMHTNPFKQIPQYYGTASRTFSCGTSDTLKIIEAAQDAVDEVFRPGFGYKKAGVLLSHIVPAGENQLDLFSGNVADNENLNKVMDQINKRFGSHTVKSLACGLRPIWKTIFNHKSKSFTTSLKELPEVKLV